jgi:hypothetical protein
MARTKVFYKAARLSGESFHTSPDGTALIYAPGYTYDIPEEEREARLCSSGVLHASDVPSETLIGGSWPCRLFEVTGTPVVGPDNHKYGFYELEVVREIEAWKAFGPNGQEILALIAWLKSPDAETWYKKINIAARDAAWNATWGAARNAALGATWGAARNAALGAAWEAARGAAREAARDAARDAAWDAAREAAWGAVLAIVARDLITAQQFKDLYPPAIATYLPADSLGPWKSLKKRGENEK